MIVGRDTEQLDEKGVVKAAVETIAENFSDGVAAPMFYMMLGGHWRDISIRQSIPWIPW